MTLDRSEQVGLGVALALHAALLWVLGLSRQPPETAPPPPIEVSFVDEAGPQSAAPTTEPAAQSYAPEVGAPEEAAPMPAEQPIPQPTPRAVPDPAPPQPRPSPRQSTPAPAEQPQRAAPRPDPPARSGAGDAQANRGSRLGPDLLKGLGPDPASRSERPSGAVMSQRAAADIASMITRQVQPCADRQRSPGPGAERIRVTIRLRLNRNGSLASPPTVVGRTGIDESNSRYADRVEDLAIATFSGCSPLRGLPDELYDVPNGWRDFRLRYSLPE